MKLIIDLMMAIALFCLLGGIVAGAIENKPFSPGPVLALLARTGARIDFAADLATGKESPSDKTFSELAEDRAGEVKAKASQYVDSLPKNQEGQVEIRALSCPKGSYESNIPQLSANKINEVTDGRLSLWEVQARWGNPHCVAGNNWSYFFDDGKTALVTEPKTGGNVSVKINGSF